MAKGKKTGGRVAGTPNKVTADVKKCMSRLLTDYSNSELFEKDWFDLEPKDRMQMFERMSCYVVPKLAATAIDVNQSKKTTISERLVELSEGIDTQDEEEE